MRNHGYHHLPFFFSWAEGEKVKNPQYRSHSPSHLLTLDMAVGASYPYPYRKMSFFCDSVDPVIFVHKMVVVWIDMNRQVVNN